MGVAVISALTLFLIHHSGAGATTSSNPDTKEILEEAGSADESQNDFWWLDSGGIATFQNGIGKTNFGKLDSDNYWRKQYAKSDPIDTDQGYYPQNIFRLIARGFWHNFTEEAYFNISAYHLSQSPQRMESNGLLLLSRYEDETTLYYSGIRVDGTAVIKKKLHGTYYTLAQTPVLPGTYNRDTNPNLLPLHQWVGLKSSIFTDSNGVHITLYLDASSTGQWKQVLTATDSGTGTEAIDSTAQAGIRTDFMDVSFKNYSATEDKD